MAHSVYEPAAFALHGIELDTNVYSAWYHADGSLIQAITTHIGERPARITDIGPIVDRLRELGRHEAPYAARNRAERLQS